MPVDLIKRSKKKVPGKYPDFYKKYNYMLDQMLSNQSSPTKFRFTQEYSPEWTVTNTYALPVPPERVVPATEREKATQWIRERLADWKYHGIEVAWVGSPPGYAWTVPVWVNNPDEIYISFSRREKSSYDPSRTVPLSLTIPVTQDMWFQEESFIKYLREKMIFWATHEVDEFFEYKGQKIYEPHNTQKSYELRKSIFDGTFKPKVDLKRKKPKRKKSQFSLVPGSLTYSLDEILKKPPVKNNFTEEQRAKLDLISKAVPVSKLMRLAPPTESSYQTSMFAAHNSIADVTNKIEASIKDMNERLKKLENLYTRGTE